MDSDEETEIQLFSSKAGASKKTETDYEPAGKKRKCDFPIATASDKLKAGDSQEKDLEEEEEEEEDRKQNKASGNDEESKDQQKDDSDQAESKLSLDQLGLNSW